MLVCLVCLIYLVCLVYLSYLVCLVYLIYLVCCFFELVVSSTNPYLYQC
jgi:hypothetical protein